MNRTPDLFRLKEDHFVLWRPANDKPKLVIGKFKLGNPCELESATEHDLSNENMPRDLWTIPVSKLTSNGLKDGQIYHYFFKVNDSNPYKSDHKEILCTDPTAWAVDWRLRAANLGVPYTDEDRDPAAVVKISGGKLVVCDPGDEDLDWGDDIAKVKSLPTNNQLVIYEMPTSWSRTAGRRGIELDVGSFRDVLAMVDKNAESGNFELSWGDKSYLEDLGINALELLPPADSWMDREWGYSTSNYMAADYDLGSPEDNSWSTATTDLVRLVRACHDRGIRFFADMVMGFARHCPMENINFMDFHVKEGPGDQDPEKDGRNSWGGQLFKYNYSTKGYDPISGEEKDIYPARQYMKLQLSHWMNFYHIDGIRVDSIKTIKNWDFVGEFNDLAREMWMARTEISGLDPGERHARFLVIGENLDTNEDIKLVNWNKINCIWNEEFKKRVRCAIQGKNAPGDNTFEETVRKMLNCREITDQDGLRYTDCAQVINYLGSHDVEGWQNERLYNFLANNQACCIDKRIKLAFACLMTAVGIPMIFAGDEFAESSDLMMGHKQIDAVNFGRRKEAWRRDVFNYVARLVRFRTKSAALGSNDIEIIHMDFAEGKRVIAWRRGSQQSPEQVVVVANFSDWGTPNPCDPRSEYVVTNWPPVSGKSWKEITLDRTVPSEWIGKEPLYPWTAKVYATV